MNTKHTQGEWNLSNGFTGTVVATVKAGYLQVVAHACGLTDKDRLANGKLIAAVPELLETLQELSDSVQFLDAVDTRTAKANINAVKAIQKATL